MTTLIWLVTALRIYRIFGICGGRKDDIMPSILRAFRIIDWDPVAEHEFGVLIIWRLSFTHHIFGIFNFIWALRHNCDQHSFVRHSVVFVNEVGLCMSICCSCHVTSWRVSWWMWVIIWIWILAGFQVVHLSSLKMQQLHQKWNYIVMFFRLRFNDRSIRMYKISLILIQNWMYLRRIAGPTLRRWFTAHTFMSPVSWLDATSRSG